MIVRILPGQDGQRAVLEQAEDFARFHVECVATITEEVLAGALSVDGAGSLRVDGECVISVEWLSVQVQTTTDQREWETKLASMLGYAESKGWYDPRTQYITAHIERVPS